jgi:hypothetical protein
VRKAAWVFSEERGGYYFAISDYIDLSLTGDLYSSGSWGVMLPPHTISDMRIPEDLM